MIFHQGASMSETQEVLTLINDNVRAENYLGSPVVVKGLVEGFCADVHGMLGRVASGELSKDAFKESLKQSIDAHADIFMGRNPDYDKIVGWNSKFGMGIAIRQSLGPFWDKHKGDYDDEPAKALFGMLAASVVDGAVSAQSDANLAGIGMRGRMESAIRILLGVHRRA
jgi:hypothetical protein